MMVMMMMMMMMMKKVVMMMAGVVQQENVPLRDACRTKKAMPWSKSLPKMESMSPFLNIEWSRKSASEYAVSTVHVDWACMNTNMGTAM